MPLTPKKKKIEKTRPQKFCEFVAEGNAPYQAAIKAGYSKEYAKNHSHKLSEKYQNEIEKFKPIAKQVIEEEFKYTIKESFNKLKEIQELALLTNAKGDYCNLSVAVKAEELKGKMFGVYEEDNKQKTPEPVQINVSDEKIEQVLKKIDNLADE